MQDKKPSGGGGSGGRKRGRGEDFSAEQLVRLQALLAENGYPSTAAKQGLATELGLELAQVGGQVCCHGWRVMLSPIFSEF